MTYSYEYTYQDFVQAQRLHRKHRKLVLMGFIFWSVLVPILAVLVSAVALYAKATGSKSLATELWPAVIWLGVMAVLLPILKAYQWRKIFKYNLPGAQRKCDATFSFGEEGVVSAIPGRSEGRFYWPAIIDFAEDSNLGLLYVKKKHFLVLPKRAMPEDAWQQLRAYINAKASK